MLTSTGQLFGTNGARGIANADLTPELATAIGRAFGGWLARHTEAARVLLARDTRVSGSMLSAATAAGLCSTGVHVTDCGILTTPGLCLLTRHRAAAGGIIISASHNPPAFNGIKLVNSQGEKLSEQDERFAESLVFADEDLGARPTSEDMGTIRSEPAAGEQYLDVLFENLGAPLSLAGLNILLDCGFGAAYQLAPEAFQRAGAQVNVLNAAPDGTRINVDSGAMNPQYLAEQVVAQGADVGVAFDGDADRALFVDHTGTVRDGDFVKYILATDLHSRGLLGPPVVVGTVMSNLGLEVALKSAGITLMRAAVGDREVVRQMKAHQAVLGGEQSGHVILAELGVGDGIYTALRVCEIAARTGRSLADLCGGMQKVPQALVNVAVKDKRAWQDSVHFRQEVSAWEAELGDRGRLLIRSSGTEPVVRVMVEALDEHLAAQAAEALAELIAHEFGYGELAPADD